MPRIDAGSLQEHRDQLRQRVFAAFAELMAERSFDAITMALLAERAGLGRTAIYRHFPDTEAVVVAFAGHETDRYVDELRSRLAGCQDAVEQLRTYVRHHLEHGERFHMGLGPALYGVLPQRSRGAIREHVVAVESVLREVLAGGASSGQLVVEDLDAAVVIVHSCLGPRHLPVARVEDFVVRALSAR
ncbi:AcrR family transcriptional regulator [Nocardioides salarius]|uniref:AcrR family transcriptional regulator n=1 Tax=Nocardioides salarius TaxID=374513 RepID=A0ABS2MDP2_9ACTN|nr:TetR/AcrR family transcriptional regulator [Nocardioides salarius]MBM7509307.1 AcrR family transcriptional regulator [Nocardioides salarius]